ncbi:MAG: c-type cytochrome [Cyclobacteriaceae bacterium]|nr:c-type cytochrome [Cyclobacteriaceae bacterium]
MKILKYLGFLVLAVIVGIGGLLTYLKLGLPDIAAAEDLKIEYTPERIERGRYLAHSVTVCMDCHSTRDWTRFSGPLTPGTLGQGGEYFDQKMGLPGVFVSKNITPEGIARYTDGELYRVITTGVNKEGIAMFPLMPYLYYGKMDPEDIYSIIAYVRTLAPIKNPVQSSVADFPVNFIINTIPQPAQPQKRPEKTDILAYGAYMTNASGCVECHTQVDGKGQIMKEVSFAGGREFIFPDGSVVRSANLTQDMESGIGQWTEDMFVQKFKVYADSTYQAPKVEPGGFNSMMPWTMYGHMETEDLKAIYAYLKTIAPISNKVTKFTPAASQ